MPDNRAMQFPKMLAFLLIFLAILFFIPTMVMYKIVKIGPIEESAAILFFPFIYSIADAITEVYGRNVAFYILILCYVLSIFFTLAAAFAIHLPSPASWQHQHAFDIVFNQGPKVALVGFLSLAASMYVNIQLMAGLKKRMRGRHFIIRSIISSSIGELVVTGVTYPILFYHKVPSLSYLMLNAYLFKLLYSIAAAFPANFLVFLIRNIDGIKQTNYSEELYSFTQTNK